MKVRLTESDLKKILDEAISFSERSIDSIEYLVNKPKCRQFLDKEALPDNLLAIFFGDQIFGAGASKQPTKGMLQNMIANDTIAKKLQDPVVVRRANKIDPEAAEAIRDGLAFAIDYTFGIMSDVFCEQIKQAVKFARSIMSALGVESEIFGTGAAAGAAAAATKINADISQELTSIYTKVANTEYFGKLNRGRITGVETIDFFFFPFSMSALSTGNASQLTETVLEQDLKALKSKFENVKSVGKFKNFFEQFFQAAFYNPVMKTSKDAETLCKSELDAINQKLSQEGAESLYESLSKQTKDDFFNRARKQIRLFQEKLGRLPNAQLLLQVFAKYSL